MLTGVPPPSTGARLEPGRSHPHAAVSQTDGLTVIGTGRFGNYRHAVPRAAPSANPRRAVGGMVTTVDRLATDAGVDALREGGTAADAAVAANAVLAVTTQHMCGLGGDLLAVVHEAGDAPVALNASGRAGSGADPGPLRRAGARHLPFRGDIRSVPVPGCVDGWTALHQRFGRLPLARLLAPAQAHATEGFPAAP